MARTREFDTDAAVEAAMGAFRRKGYEGTSIQDLVDATGLGRGSLYAAFGSKDGLYLAVMDRYRELYAVPLVELLGSGVEPKVLIREAMVGLVDEIVEDGNRQACLVVGATMERTRHDVSVAERVQAITRSLEDAFFEVLVQAQADGSVPGTRTAGDLARFLVMSLQGIRVMGAIDSDREPLMAMVEIVLSCLD
jgi:TetR/AcrR family transcriptional regulator, transcriptional repressor for nem operon